jgi:hypothetical protein
MRLRRVSENDLRANPYAVWNAFVDLLARSKYEDLHPTQRGAHLAFWYDSELQNGGHLQYFLNRQDRIHNTGAALRALGALEQADVFEQALSVWRSRSRTPPASAEEYVETALDGEFDTLDSAFYRCSISITEVLQRHLAEYEKNFVVRGGAQQQSGFVGSVKRSMQFVRRLLDHLKRHRS